MRTLLTICLLAVFLPAAHAEKKIRVFIALCDNKTQGIIPVGAKIGDGDKPEDNLYWGCDDGFDSVFRHSKEWKVVAAKKDVSPAIMRRLELQSAAGDLVMTADAYRGSAMRLCLEDFEKAVASGEDQLVVYIGHNGLMDFTLPETAVKPGARSDSIVLCCISGRYFGDRLRRLGSRPVLTTQQLMYPGAFILRDVIAVWKKGASPATLREVAGAAYAKNQHISVKAATGVFAPAEVAR